MDRDHGISGGGLLVGERLVTPVELQDEEHMLRIMKECWNDNNEDLLPPLFHGTDFSLMGLSKDERNQINDACVYVIKTLVKCFEANDVGITDKRLIESRDEHGNSATAYSSAKSRMNNSPLYSYGEFYVTNAPERAINYAKSAWIYGETGWVANRLIIGAKKLGIELPQDDEFTKALAVLEFRAGKDKDPVILMVVNGDSSDCYNERGDFITADAEGLSFYIGIMRSRSSMCSFRLGERTMQNDVDIYLVRESNFDKLKHACKNL